MRIYSFVLSLLLLSMGCSEQNRTFVSSEIMLLPKPEKLTLGAHSFALEAEMSVSVESESQKSAAHFLIDRIKETTGLGLSLNRNGEITAIRYVSAPDLKPEAYELHVTPEKITLKASDAAGYFYGSQTLLQLLVPDDTNASPIAKKWLVPSLAISDAPRFGWRAYMLDEARYFHGEAFVKQMLDQMAMLKMNIFHWHLTDDAGWRIEIKKYPKLTGVGAKRTDSEIETWKSGKLAGEPHSGFYTQEQIKNIVAYAADRNITIVPEFEIPGHASAAIAAYSWLGTAGKEIEVPVLFGRHYDNYDVTKPAVIQFVKDVLTEMFALFPSEVVHIGGDEVGYKVWEESKHVRKYMRENGIKTPADLQIRFTNEISKFIEQNGRRMMGWNEIMGVNVHTDFEEKKNDSEAETDLAKNVVVHFWKGNLELATQAAQKEYQIVNSLHSNTYLDYTYKDISLKKAYDFDPIPKGLNEKYHKNVLGLGCQMWSEWTPTANDVEYQTFPRIAAYAEVGWTTLENKDFNSFQTSLKKLQEHWHSLGINYAKLSENITEQVLQ